MINKIIDYILGVRPYKCPEKYLRNHIEIDNNEKNYIKSSILTNYFTIPAYYPDTVDKYIKTETGQKDLEDHISGRLSYNRDLGIPWIDNTLSLMDARVLEIGCGTGSATLALVEQGAKVVASDVENGSLKVAQDRVNICGLDAAFICCNATEIHKKIDLKEFNLIIFFAVLEHMTIQERLETLRNIWEGINPGAYIVVSETPNRLWYHDFHTSQEYFFMWLPSEIAKIYAKYTKRELFNTTVDESTSEIDFVRWGRGVSFHDFSLAFSKTPELLPVVSCMELYKRKLTKRDRYYKINLERKYEEILQSFTPDIHRGFFLNWLDLIFIKK